jgi:hypothetical protein
MITKLDWQAVHAQLLAERRRRLGDPPTVEEMLAYSRGELSQEDEERVRALLVSYPELLRALNADFDDDDAQPGDPDYFSEEAVTRQWNEFQQRVGRRGGESDAGRVLPFWRATAAIAAALAVAFGALLWRAQSKLDDPRLGMWQEKSLEPEGYRGRGDALPAFSSEADMFLLTLMLLDERSFPSYRIDIVADGSNRPVWSSEATRPEDDNFTIIVPRAFLPPGTYRASIRGVDGTRDERLATYAFRVR